jgi:hypothetical protein
MALGSWDCGSPACFCYRDWTDSCVGGDLPKWRISVPDLGACHFSYHVHTITAVRYATFRIVDKPMLRHEVAKSVCHRVFRAQKGTSSLSWFPDSFSEFSVVFDGFYDNASGSRFCEIVINNLRELDEPSLSANESSTLVQRQTPGTDVLSAPSCANAT